MLRLAPQRSPTVCAVLSSVSATTVDNSGMYVYYLKGSASLRLYVLDARLELWFLWNTPVLVHLQQTKLSDAQALPTPCLGRSTRGLQPVLSSNEVDLLRYST